MICLIIPYFSYVPVLVNDYGLPLTDLMANSGQDASISGFNKTYSVLKAHGLPLVTRSVKVTIAEQVILVNKIHSRVKMEKTKNNLQNEVETLKTAQMRMVEEKAQEGQELKENIEESNVECRERLEQIRRNTSNNIKQMEWQSNKRQIQMKDKILELLGNKKV